MTNTPLPSSTPEPEREGAASILSDLKGTGDGPAVADLGGVNPTSAKSKLKVHSQTLVIALVLAASGAALYTMRKQGMGAGVNFNPPKIDYQVDKVKRTASDAQQQRVLEDLARSQSPPQVPAEKIQKNPFQLDSTGGVTKPSTAMVDPDAQSRNLAQQRQQQLTSALTSIEVNAIMAGPVPLARINGKIVREGDSVGEFFTVRVIHDRSVELEADGKVFAVSMSESAGGGGRPRSSAPRR